MTQEQQILAALKAGRRITSIDALRDFSCFRLGARIYDLKQSGHSITKTMVETDGGAHVARYSLDAKA
jgi:hypothetical protein